MPPKNNLPPGYDPQKDKIEIVEYDPQWPILFLQEAVFLRKALAFAPGLAIEHCGSTAVPGMSSKPIIDILLAVESRDHWPGLIQPLQTLGYLHGKDAFDESHWFFVKGMPPFGERRTHQIHLMENPSFSWKKHLAFRDYLRNHPEDSRLYEELKKDLALKFSADREAYTEAKAEFIRSVFEKIPG